jgi:mediator of RNA polymerase II transcription subunit 4
MRRGHLNSEEPLGPLGETHSVGRRKCSLKTSTLLITHIIVVSVAPSPSPDPHRAQVANPYRPLENNPSQPLFDLDLDLNPDL